MESHPSEFKRSQLWEIAKRWELHDFEKRLEEIKFDCPVSLAFLGEFKSGKSTIVNCLLGEKILPVAEEPTTHAITEIVGSDKNYYFILKNDDSIEEISRSKIGYYIAGEGAKEVKKVVLQIPEKGIIKKGIIIVDTPGISSLNEVDERITYGYLPLVDAAFIIVNINYGTLPFSLLSFLKEKVLKEDIVKIFFILNFADTKTPESNEKIKNEVIELLRKEGISEEPVVIVLSAKRGIEGLSDPILWKESNMELLLKTIQEEIIERKRRLVDKKEKENLISIAKDMERILNEKLNGFMLSTDELDKRIGEIREEIEKLENEKRKLEEKFYNCERDSREKMKNIVENYTPAIINSIVRSGDIPEEVLGLINGEMENIDKNVSIYLGEFKDKINASFQLYPSYLKNIILDKIELIHEIKELAVVGADFAIVSLLIPGGFFGGGAAKAGGEAAKMGIKEVLKKGTPYLAEIVITGLASKERKGAKGQKKRESKLKKVGEIIGGILQRLNIPQLIADKVEEKLIKEKVRNALFENLNNVISSRIHQIKSIVDMEIERKFLHPLKELERALSNLKKERKQRIEEQEEIKRRIKTDIETLQRIINYE